MNAKALQEQPQLHIPVMASEVLTYLNLQPNGAYLDGTIGAGGHATQILNQLSANGKLIGIDRDAEALEICSKHFSASAQPVLLYHSSYDQFPEILKKLGISELNGMVLDLGISTMQLDSDSRGFGFKTNGKLDMRFNEETGETAAELISRLSERELADFIYQYGEERHSRKIARTIKSLKQLTTAADLKEAVRRSTPPHQRNKSLARVFQAKIGRAHV